jgi:hypothetical protein
MIQYIVALHLAWGGGSGRLESAGWKDRLMSKESRQKSYGSRKINISFVSMSSLLLLFVHRIDSRSRLEVRLSGPFGSPGLPAI